MMADHTPGPWIVAGFAKDAEPSTPVRWTVWSDGISEKVADHVRTQVDADLIAAAPALLAALEHIREAMMKASDALEDIGTNEPAAEPVFWRLREIWLELRQSLNQHAAIAKAKGDADPSPK